MYVAGIRGQVSGAKATSRVPKGTQPTQVTGIEVNASSSRESVGRKGEGEERRYFAVRL